MIPFLVKVFILASAMLLSRAKETASKVWIISIMLYDPDITHSSDTVFRPNETPLSIKNEGIFFSKLLSFRLKKDWVIGSLEHQIQKTCGNRFYSILVFFYFVVFCLVLNTL